MGFISHAQGNLCLPCCSDNKELKTGIFFPPAKSHGVDLANIAKKYCKSDIRYWVQWDSQLVEREPWGEANGSPWHSHHGPCAPLCTCTPYSHSPASAMIFFFCYLDGNSVGLLILILLPPMLTSLSQRTTTCQEDPTLLPNLQPIIACSTSLSNNEPRYSAAIVRLEWLACLSSLSADHRHNAMA